MEGEIQLVGLERLASGREAEVFALDARWVLRVAHFDEGATAVRREALVLAAGKTAGAPMPIVEGSVTVDGRPGLIVERLGHPDLLSRLERRPWTIFSSASALGSVHARLHDVPAPSELPALREQLAAQLGSPLVPADVRRRALARLDELPDGDRLCHCDYHPANVLPSPSGYAAIDWGHAARGVAAADVARTLLLLGDAALPDTAGPFTRAFAAIGRRILIGGYLRAYRRITPIVEDDITMWRPVLLAARLAEDIAAERAPLLALTRSVT